jgi:hypothetical protein
MKHSYASVGSSQAYVKKSQPRLTVGDYIWVVDGDTASPANFVFADCFEVDAITPPPYPPDYSDFKCHAAGKSLAAKKGIPLTSSMDWFKELHERYVTKQRLFMCIDSEADILDGMSTLAGIKI